MLYSNYKLILNPDKEEGTPPEACRWKMTTAATAYLLNNFTPVRTLKQTATASVAIVTGEDKTFYVLKKSQRTGLPYQQLQALSHPALPRIYFVQEENGVTTVLEEYINGKNLANLAAAGPLPESQVQDIALQVCQALAFLHAHKILHRDIKPSNLIQQPDGRVKLLDFDAARTFREDAASDTRLLGTKGFAPPEQYGFAQTDGRSDLFALGKTMAVLLGPAYHGRLTAIIHKATQIDAAKRYPDAGSMARALEHSTWRYGALHYGLPAAVALLLVAGGWWFHQSNRQFNLFPASSAAPALTDSSAPSQTAGKTMTAKEKAAAGVGKDQESLPPVKTGNPPAKETSTATDGAKTAAPRPKVHYIPLRKGDLAISYTNPSTGRTLPLRLVDYDNAILLPTPRDFTVTFTVTNKSAYTLKHPMLVFCKDRLTARSSTGLDRNDKLTNLPLAEQMTPGASVTTTITFHQLALSNPVANFLIFVAADDLGTAPENFYLIFWAQKSQGKGVDW